MPTVILPDRTLISVSGDDAEHLLQNVITCNVETLPESTARAGALLTPQGKIMFDFLIWRDGSGGYTIDIRADQVDAFLKRMTMYKLRSKVEFSVLDESLVGISFEGDSNFSDIDSTASFADERFTAMAINRILIAKDQAGQPSDDISVWHALRITNGVAEGGYDFAFSDAFPHDVSLDQNHGVDFRKGCYVGQEVVSRMQHRGTARKRVMIVAALGSLPETGTEVSADGKPVGALGTVAGTSALMIGRLDRVKAAIDNGTKLIAGDTEIDAVSLPPNIAYNWPSDEASTDAG
ncbi:MAG: folate-binding protein YgfZ [Pseudomonadota bacterium]